MNYGLFYDLKSSLIFSQSRNGRYDRVIYFAPLAPLRDSLFLHYEI